MTRRWAKPASDSHHKKRTTVLRGDHDVDIRLMGTPTEIADAIERLKAVFTVQEVSTYRPNRGDSQRGRVYVTVSMHNTTPVPVLADAVRTDRNQISPATSPARSNRTRP